MSHLRPNRSLCVVTAAAVEFNAVARLLSDAEHSSEGGLKRCRGRLGENQITVLMSEIGAAGFAEKLSQRLAANRYDELIVTGLAGGLDERLKVGDVVVYDSCIRITGAAVKSGAEEKQLIKCDAQLSASVCERLNSQGMPHQRIVGLTVDRIIVSAADKRALNRRYGAAAVDMETYQALVICAQAGLPATAVRVVSDAANDDLPDFNRALDPRGRISGLRAALAMIRSPVAAGRFLLNLRRAMRSLKQIAGAVLGQPERAEWPGQEQVRKRPESTDSEG
jgi:adenosylhomocysteine nucleosidase